MNLIIPLKKYSSINIFFSEIIKNNIHEDNYFIKPLYSNNEFILNTLFLNFTLFTITTEKYFNNKTIIFNINVNSNIISELINIENEILKKVNINNKIPTYKLKQQIESGTLKFYDQNNTFGTNNNNENIIIKISGIWVNSIEYGIKYKFLLYNNLL